MDFLFADIFFHIIGRLFLFFRYRNKEKRKAVLVEKYFDSYSGVGSDVIMRSFAFICFLLMVALIGVVIYGTIIHGIS